MGNEYNPSAPPHIVREAAFDEELEKIAKNYKRLDELDAAIDWALSHNPTAFFNLNDGYYLWKMERISDNFPQLRIVYRFDNAKNTVYLIAASEIPAS